ncbi:hypothetical protein SDC9_104396 [bioreactor metagenome]|uniref:Uncharacterized protein n=1 Tax=bioreactor metagenome TaxID=1076179 RepID=A0A645B796_9ZZZZ
MEEIALTVSCIIDGQSVQGNLYFTVEDGIIPKQACGIGLFGGYGSKECSALYQLPAEGVEGLVAVVAVLHLCKQGENQAEKDDHQGKDDREHRQVVGEEPASECSCSLRCVFTIHDEPV